MPLKNPNLPRARIITGYGEPFWIVFLGAYRGYGRCGIDGDCSLEGAYRSWLATFDLRPEDSPLAC